MATRQDEFELTVMPQSRSLLRVARRLTAHAGDAEDLVQETLFLAWRSFHQFRQATNARAWLFKILFNSFYSGQRKRQAESAALPVESSVSVGSVVESLDVARALDALSSEYRTVLMLAVVEGFTSREIADILDIPIGTVMSRLSRARQALRAQIVPSSQYSGKETS